MCKEKGKGIWEVDMFQVSEFASYAGRKHWPKAQPHPNPQAPRVLKVRQSMQHVLISSNKRVIFVRDDVPDETPTYFSLFLTSLLCAL